MNFGVLLEFWVYRLLEIYSLIILARVLMSWIRPPRYSRRYYKFLRFMDSLTEPVLGPIRSLLPRGPIDFSPIIALLIVIPLARFLLVSIIRLLPL
jgi:YggT family protein